MFVSIICVCRSRKSKQEKEEEEEEEAAGEKNDYFNFSKRSKEEI